ncbi:uncharacterized protein LOC108682520 [Hyalella azteca]|uniref:Uncharacterized protein LOC108682520 n=1 Tax=Hyalella azteca TaxID=294128 RepID=A0A8B7PMG8_HYAAZ|nr:uncharacterized protein LOC108682520 [Hyalella azteca]
MKINRDTVLIKAHYFFFFAGMVPVLPFSMVLGLGLGVPIILQGLMAAVVLVGTVIAKPILSLIADTFPRSRRIIFIASILMCGLSLGCVCFVPSFGLEPSFDKAWLLPANYNITDAEKIHRKPSSEKLTLISDDSKFNEEIIGNQSKWESLGEIPGMEKYVANFSWSDLTLYLPVGESCHLVSGVDCQLTRKYPSRTVDHLQVTLASNYSSSELGLLPYRIASRNILNLDVVGRVSVKCNAGQQEGLGCQPVEVWTKMGFWAFFSLMMIGMISFCTANSFSDAVTIETIGPSGNYGSQRAWGSLGWGLMGPVSGLLVDWWSGYAELKDYTPAYLLVFLIMGVDVVLSSNLKVPKLDAERNVWSSVWPLLQEPRFFLFLLFSVLNGCFDGVVLNFLFVLQEDMAAGSAAVQNIKFLQGITIFVQCATEVPCMFFSHVLVKKIGADRVTTLVLGLHAIRLYLITCVGTWGNVWLTVAVEVLNGPCYGLGYSAIVVYAGQLAPPGASTTVQSLANICYESIGYALCSVTSGVIVATAGSVRLFLVWGVVASITTLLHFFYVVWIASRADPLVNPSLQKRCNNEGEATVEEHLYLRAENSDHTHIKPVNSEASRNSSSSKRPSSGAFSEQKVAGLSGLRSSDNEDSDTESELCESIREKLSSCADEPCMCIRHSKTGITIAECRKCAAEKTCFLNGSVGPACGPSYLQDVDKQPLADAINSDGNRNSSACTLNHFPIASIDVSNVRDTRALDSTSNLQGLETGPTDRSTLYCYVSNV